jgi:hypothetical protein
VTGGFSRRTLIGAGVALLAGAAAVGTAIFRNDSSSSPSTAPTTGAPTPGGQVRAIAAVGDAYLAQADEPKPISGFDVSGGDEVLARFGRLATRVHDDFHQSRTVLVDGWRLAHTEAAAAGLLSLELSAHAPR